MLEANPLIPNIIPETRELPDGRLVVPHDVGTTRILRNLKYQVPSPIHHSYDWNGTTPFLAQKATAAMLVTEPKAYVLSGMGVGKTRAVLYAYDYLRKENRVGKMLVVAPLSTLNFTWAREVWANFPGYRVGVLYGTKERRLKILAEDHDIYVVNHDGPRVIGDALRRKSFDVVCIDELSVFRNHRADRSKALAKLLTDRPYVWGLTGTPTPKDPTDAYGLIRLIQPGSPFISSYSRFRDDLMVKVSQFRWSPRPGAQEKVYQYMQPAVRFTLQECVDIPPLTYQDREVSLSPKQNKAYKALKDYCFAKSDEGQSIMAANEAVLLNKLLQVSAGCVYDDKKNVVLLDSQDRLAVTLESVMETENKAIVFVPFVPLVKMVGDYLGSHGVKVNRISGETPASERDKIFAAFQDFKAKKGEKEVIVAHPGTMSHGLTLTAADLIVWYSPISSLETYLQANARIARPGQTSNKVSIVHLVGTPVDKKVYSRLRSKQKVQGDLLDLFTD